MSATYGWLQGFSKSGTPLQKRPRTARGHRSVWSKVGTWQTFAVAEVFGDGSGTVEVVRNGKTIHRYTIPSEHRLFTIPSER